MGTVNIFVAYFPAGTRRRIGDGDIAAHAHGEDAATLRRQREDLRDDRSVAMAQKRGLHLVAGDYNFVMPTEDRFDK